MGHDRNNRTLPLRRRFQWLLISCSLLICVTGCRGCAWTGAQQSGTKKLTEAEKKKQEENKLRLASRDLQLSPSQEGQAINSVKPGHWYQGKQEVKANQADESLDITTEMVDRRLDPVPIRGSSIFLRFKREAVLAKGQSKSPELMLYVPDMPAELDENGMPTKPTIRMLYSQKGLGAPLLETPVPSNLSRPEQYSVVVFAKDTTRHNFWSGLSCMVWPTTTLLDDEQKTAPHRAVTVKESEAVSTFPNSALMWTSTSHFVWYDSDPAMVNEIQQRAIIDWIHMGGQLILSGPDSLAAINNSFLSPWLPLKQIESATVTEDLATPFAKAWQVRSEPLENQFRIPTNRQIPRIQGQLTEGSHWIEGADNLVATRAVGNGHVTMSTFPISDDAFVRWSGYSSFVNGALLQHPPRTWVKKDLLEGGMQWIQAYRGREGDPELSTSFRTLTRDGKTFVAIPRRRSREENSEPTPTEKEVTRSFNTPTPTSTTVANAPDSLSMPQTATAPSNNWFEVKSGSRGRSAGGWNDSSPISVGAMESLTAASGITVPKLGLIVKLLLGYLIVLVPVNWLVFRLLGRVELAWLAVPVLAILGAGLVAKSVQLDIGFSRSESRVTCLELFEGYSRAHQTSYVSLYTSLSESYKVVFPDGEGVVLPAVTGSTTAARARRESQIMDYRYAAEGGSGLVSFPVRSNSTGLLHSEEWLELGGLFRSVIDADLSSIQLENSTPYSLKDVAVCGVSDAGDWQAGWVGTLGAGNKHRVNLKVGDVRERWFSEWDTVPFTKKYEAVLSTDGRSSLKGQVDGQLSVGQMLDAAIQSIEFRPGKYVALGWIDEEIGALSILPKASQQNRRTMFVIHLSQGRDMSLGPDHSLPPKSLDPEPVSTGAESN